MILFQTGTFWTSILAFIVFAEPLIPLEVVAMIVCFACMVTMTLVGSNNASEADDDTALVVDDEAAYSKNNLILGYGLIFITSWIYASNCILNRALKNVHHAILMFWHAIIGLTIASVAVLIEAAVVGDGIRIFHYDSSIYLLLLGAALFDTITVNSVTIAFQSDSSGFVSLISYISIVYAFIADMLIFNESFSTIELVAALTILTVTVATAAYKIREGKRAKLQRADSFTSVEDVNMSMVKFD